MERLTRHVSVTGWRIAGSKLLWTIHVRRHSINVNLITD